MKTIKINRKRWLRGREDGYLWLASKQRGCCLGHAVKQLTSCTWAKLESKRLPEDVLSDKELAKHFGPYHRIYGFAPIADENDDKGLTDVVREAKLKKLFKDWFGLTLKFYN